MMRPIRRLFSLLILGAAMWIASPLDAAGEQMAVPALQVGSGGDTVTVDSFKAVLSGAPDSIHLIDVRDEAEFAEAHFPNARNIPIDDLEDLIAELPSDRPLIFVCATGARSSEAYDIVKLLREDLRVYFLDAEIIYKDGGFYDIVAAAE